MSLTFRNRPALVAYLTCGDPSLEVTREVALAAISAGADAIELGVPFSDPVADGPVIQRASERAVANGTTLEGVLRVGREIRRESDAGLIVFTYLNPILRFGLSRFCSAAADSGIDGALITDLPVEESAEYVRCMRERNLATVFLVAPTSTDARLKTIARLCTGFVYAVSRTGVTGERAQLSQDAHGLVRRLRKYTKLPIAVGFGISNAEQFAAVGEYADIAAIGSAIVHIMELNPNHEADAVRKFVSGLRKPHVAGMTSLRA